MRIIIPGASGFVGTNLQNYLLNNKEMLRSIDEIVLIDILQYGEQLQTSSLVDSKKIKFIKGSIYSPGLFNKIIKEDDIIVHLAVEANTFDNPQTSTTDGTMHYLQALSKKKIKKFIYLSSADVYGINNSDNLLESEILSPTTIYSANKVAFEAYLKAFYSLMNLPNIILRPVTIYGPSQYPGWLIPRIITRALNNEKIQITGDGSVRRDWIYVDDICQLLLKIIFSTNEKIINEVYNIGSGQEQTVMDVTKYILDKLQKPTSLIELIPERAGDIPRQITKSEKAQLAFNWKSKVKLHEGINKTIDFYKSLTSH